MSFFILLLTVRELKEHPGNVPAKQQSGAGLCYEYFVKNW